MVSRRGFLTLLGGVLLVPAAVAVERTYFLAPRGGWLEPLARMLVPLSDIEPWREEIASGRFSYDRQTEMLCLWERTSSREAEDREAYHPENDRACRWAVPDVAALNYSARDIASPCEAEAPRLVVMRGSRAAIDDGMSGFGAPTERDAYNDWVRNRYPLR